MSNSRFPIRKGIILIALLSGCSGATLNSLWSTDQATTEGGKTSTGQTPAGQTGAKQVQPAKKNIEIMWQVPNEAVDAYHVYVRDAAGDEKRHYRIPIAKLSKRDHPSYGPVYTYVVPDATKGDSSLIVIRAENAFGLSEPSEPQTVD